LALSYTSHNCALALAWVAHGLAGGRGGARIDSCHAQ